jgi:RNA polymerase sigma-70 factor (ECF subfamily)
VGGREDDDDFAAMQRAAGGDAMAFEGIVRRFRPDVLRLARRFAMSDAEAEDLTQQSFMRAHASAGTYRGESALKTWLYRITVNVAMSARRARVGGDGVSLEEVDIITNALGTARMHARQVARRLGQALERLPPKQRLVVELRLLRELPFRQIAEIADCSELAARANYQHAVKKLREWVDE